MTKTTLRQGVQRIVVTYIDRWRGPIVALVPLSKIGFASPQVWSSSLAEAALKREILQPGTVGFNADCQSLPQKREVAVERLRTALPIRARASKVSGPAQGLSASFVCTRPEGDVAAEARFV